MNYEKPKRKRSSYSSYRVVKTCELIFEPVFKSVVLAAEASRALLDLGPLGDFVSHRSLDFKHYRIRPRPDASKLRTFSKLSPMNLDSNSCADILAET